ncbi:hypothetical protein MKEN_00112500 [Mycena kentingensis (nom. inval.)]|nr:hypothetical protein MKEN_00112500 [Mycena kentingensis (nom. inval.)]
MASNAPPPPAFYPTPPPVPRQPGPGLAAGAEDSKYQAKYKDLKRKVKEIEHDNDKLHYKILQAKRGIQRMKLERAVLYERLQQVPPNPDMIVLPTPGGRLPPHLQQQEQQQQTREMDREDLKNHRIWTVEVPLEVITTDRPLRNNSITRIHLFSTPLPLTGVHLRLVDAVLLLQDRRHNFTNRPNIPIPNTKVLQWHIRVDTSLLRSQVLISMNSRRARSSPHRCILRPRPGTYINREDERGRPREQQQPVVIKQSNSPPPNLLRHYDPPPQPPSSSRPPPNAYYPERRNPYSRSNSPVSGHSGSGSAPPHPDSVPSRPDSRGPGGPPPPGQQYYDERDREPSRPRGGFRLRPVTQGSGDDVDMHGPPPPHVHGHPHAHRHPHGYDEPPPLPRNGGGGAPYMVGLPPPGGPAPPPPLDSRKRTRNEMEVDGDEPMYPRHLPPHPHDAADPRSSKRYHQA